MTENQYLRCADCGELGTHFSVVVKKGMDVMCPTRYECERCGGREVEWGDDAL